MARITLVLPATILLIVAIVAAGVWVPARGNAHPLLDRAAGPPILPAVPPGGQTPTIGSLREHLLGPPAAIRVDRAELVAPPGASPLASGATGGWWNLTPTLVLAPPQRSGAAIAYDPTSSQVVLFGGWNGSTLLGDTWVFQQGSWTKIRTSLSPSARADAAFAFDPKIGGCVLFGGRNATSAMNDTWIFSSANWSRIATNGSPTPRSSSGLAFDPSSNRTLLFGGLGISGVALGDTWVFDGTNWTARSTSPAPSARFGASLIADPAIRSVLLFGGATGPAGAALNDTWSFGNGSWTQQLPSTSPPARFGASAAFLPAASAVLLFGGLDPTGSLYRNDLWQFRGTSWAAVLSADQPTPRANASLVSDDADGYLLLVGGDAGAVPQAENWVFTRPLTPVAYSSALETDSTLLVLFNATVAGGVPPYLFNWRTSTGLGSPISVDPAWSASFRSPGSVVVTVLASDRVGADASTNLTLTVDPLPSVSARAAAIATDVGVPAVFSGVASGGVAPLTVFWTFGDGYSAGGENATHRFASPGSFVANVTVRDALGANSTARLPVTVATLPHSPISASQATTVVGYPVVFSVIPSGGTGGISVRWNFGDGQSATGESVSHSFATAGQFGVTANLTDRVNGSGVERFTETVTNPPASAPSSLGTELLLLVPVLLIAIAGAAVWGRRRKRTRFERSGEPGLEPGEPSSEELPDAEVLPGGGQEYDEPEGGE